MIKYIALLAAVYLILGMCDTTKAIAQVPAEECIYSRVGDDPKTVCIPYGGYFYTPAPNTHYYLSNMSDTNLVIVGSWFVGVDHYSDHGLSQSPSYLYPHTWEKDYLEIGVDANTISLVGVCLSPLVPYFTRDALAHAITRCQ